MRVAVIDLGTNSTRLLVGDVEDGSVAPLHRESRVTGLGRGVETSGQLATDAIGNVYEAVGDYVELARIHGAEEVVAVATSAVRDASNGDAFLAELRERFSLDARTIDGLEEARLTYRGALSGGHVNGETLVVDIGGGSTELIVGSGPEPDFHTSLQVGVVRHSERHVHADPPRTEELESLSSDIGAVLESELAANPGLRADPCDRRRRHSGHARRDRARARALRPRRGRGPRAVARERSAVVLPSRLPTARGAP